MSTHNEIDREAQKDPSTLEREIDQQRAEIGNIVHALESKLSPGQMIDTALGYAKGGGGEFLHNLTDTVKANPVPTLLTSIGLVWLMAGQNRRPDYSASMSTGPSMTDKLAAKAAGIKQQGTGIKDKAAQMSHDASSSLDNARHRVSDSSRHAAESLRHTADRARGGFTQLLNEQPLALGAIGIALGALLAASVPPTRREDELMGQQSDELTGKIKDKAREGYEMVSAEGEQLASQVKHDIERDHGQPASRPH